MAAVAEVLSTNTEELKEQIEILRSEANRLNGQISRAQLNARPVRTAEKAHADVDAAFGRAIGRPDSALLSWIRKSLGFAGEQNPFLPESLLETLTASAVLEPYRARAHELVDQVDAAGAFPAPDTAVDGWRLQKQILREAIRELEDHRQAIIVGRTMPKSVPRWRK